MRTLIRTAGRFLLAGIFVYSGYGLFQNAEGYAKRASAAIPMLPEDPTIAKVHGAIIMIAPCTLAIVGSSHSR
jgi:uncharacterized membrane protein YphA (DoxX/SURF4 family)